jgi:hypothetical protein
MHRTHQQLCFVCYGLLSVQPAADQPSVPLSPLLPLCCAVELQAKATQSYYTPYEVLTAATSACMSAQTTPDQGLSSGSAAVLQVACHNTPTDCWVSLLGAVYDVTRLLRDFPGALTEPILAAAGTDVSHWCATTQGTGSGMASTAHKGMCPTHAAVLIRVVLHGQHSTNEEFGSHMLLTRAAMLVLVCCRFDAATGDVRYCVDPETQLKVPYCPQVGASSTTSPAG